MSKSKVIKYTGEKTYLFPNGSIASPEVVKSEYPGCEIATFVAITDESEETIYSFQSLASMKQVHNIDQSLSEDEAIKAIEDKLNNPVIDNSERILPAEERIAAVLEYQTMMSM